MSLTHVNEAPVKRAHGNASRVRQPAPRGRHMVFKGTFMRVLIVGAGIIGTIFGWALSRAGHDVAHLVRPGRAAPLADGIAMDVVDRRRGHKGRFRGQYLLTAVESLQPSDRFDMVIVPVKHYQLESTLAQLVPLAGAADFVVLTQNWDGAAAVDALLPRARYLYGDAKAGGSFINGTLVCALRAIDIGPSEGAPTPLDEKAAGLFRSAGIPTTLHGDMLHYLWVQYAFTGAMWAALIDAGSVAAIFGSGRRVDRLMAACRECLDVARLRGVELARYPEIRPILQTAGLGRRLAIFMASLMFKYDAYTKRCSAHAFGDPAEVARFYDDLVGSGHSLCVPMPAMDGYATSINRFAAAGGGPCAIARQIG